MSGCLSHARPLQVLGLLPATTRLRLMLGMRSLGVLVSMLRPFGGVPLPSTRGRGSTPWCRCFLGLGDSESHTAGSEGWVTCRVSVHPVGASLPTLYSAPTANGVRNAFPRVGKLESSREHSVSSGRGRALARPARQQTSPTLEKKKKNPLGAPRIPPPPLSPRPPAPRALPPL